MRDWAAFPGKGRGKVSVEPQKTRWFLYSHPEVLETEHRGMVSQGGQNSSNEEGENTARVGSWALEMHTGICIWVYLGRLAPTASCEGYPGINCLQS